MHLNPLGHLLCRYLGLTPEVALNMGRALVMGGLQHQLSSLLLHCNPGVGVEVAYLLRGAGRGLRQVGLRACGLGKGQWKAVSRFLPPHNMESKTLA